MKNLFIIALAMMVSFPAMAADMPSDGGNRPIPVLAYNGTVHAVSVSSTTARNGTTITVGVDVVTVVCATAFHFKQGGSSITAATTDMLWPANVPLDLKTDKDKYIAFILDSGTDTAYIGERK